MRSLAYAIARGDAPCLTSSSEAIEYIEKTGGIEFWMNAKQISWIL